MLAEHVLELLGSVDEAGAALADLVLGELRRVAGPLHLDPGGVQLVVR
jgi:hypothetical protein